MIRAEYLRFLQKLTVTNVDDDVRKIADLVLNHLDTLIPLSTSQGQRIKKVIHLAQDNWLTINTNIQRAPAHYLSSMTPSMLLMMITASQFAGHCLKIDFLMMSR